MLLLTAAATPLGRAAHRALTRANHTVRPTDLLDLTSPTETATLLDGVDTIIHLAPLLLAETHPETPPADLLDIAARGTHVLYKAALSAGITRAVQTSTLSVMDAYDSDLEITEQWRPRPGPNPNHLAPYLAELVAREFARDPQLDTPLDVVCLRLADLTALSVEHAANAIVSAVAYLRDGPRPRGHHFRLFHIADPSPTARYSSALAQRTLGRAAPI